MNLIEQGIAQAGLEGDPNPFGPLIKEFSANVQQYGPMAAFLPLTGSFEKTAGIAELLNGILNNISHHYPDYLGAGGFFAASKLVEKIGKAPRTFLAPPGRLIRDVFLAIGAGLATHGVTGNNFTLAVLVPALILRHRRIPGYDKVHPYIALGFATLGLICAISNPDSVNPRVVCPGVVEYVESAAKMLGNLPK